MEPATGTTLPEGTSAVFFLLVRHPDGSPTGYPMTGFFRNGGIEFTTYRKSAKARYVLADDRVCCVIPDPDESGGIAVWGHCGPVDASGFDPGAGDLGPRPMEVPAAMQESVKAALTTGRRMLFRVIPERSRRLALADRHG